MILTFQEIYSELQKDYRQVLMNCSENNIIGIFSKGSYNRNLVDDFSDFDTVALVFDGIGVDTLCPWSNRFGKIFILTFADFKRQLNVCGFLVWDETLFSKYYYLNPIYKDIFFLLMEMREEIFLAQPIRFASSILINMQYSMRMIPRYEEVEKDPFLTYKQLSHLVREKDVLKNFLNNYPDITFIELNSLSRQPEEYIRYLKKLKRGQIQLDDKDLTITEYAKQIFLEGIQYYNKIQAITKPDEDKAIFIKMNCILAELEKQRKEK